MSFKPLHFASWSVGMLGFIAVIWIFQPDQFFQTLRTVGLYGTLTWLALTLLARMVLVEATVGPVALLGFKLRRIDVFWIGWIRSFANQILPLSGLAIYVRAIQRRSGIAWSELTALSTPQVFLSAAALGLLGAVAVSIGHRYFDESAAVITLVFAVMSCVAILAAVKAGWLVERVAGKRLPFALRAADSFKVLSKHPITIVKLIGIHCLAILIRGGRIWVLFICVGVSLGWEEALVMMAIAESATIFQLTPGGLGLREGAIVGASALLGIPTEIGAAVALIDRLLLVVTTTCLAAPAYVLLRESEPRHR